MKYATILSLLLFTPLATAQDTSTPPPPQYNSSNAELESELAETKANAEKGDIAAAWQVYSRYAQQGMREQAEAWYHRRMQLREAQANNGDIAAAREMGLLYLRGDMYVAPNAQKAVSLLSQATERGDATSAIILGEHFKTYSPEESKQFYTRAYELHKAVIDTITDGSELTAEQRQSLEIIGNMEQEGLGTEQNAAAGIAHLEQAGTTGAIERLFQTYAKGIGVDVDAAKALSYAAMIADTAADTAQPQKATPNAGVMAWLLADSYLNGKNGVQQNTELGEKYLSIADSQNIAPAIYCKALRQKAAGNSKEAYIDFTRAASMGHPDARMHAALMKLYGAEGVTKNEETAVETLKKISDRHNQGQEWYVGRAPYELALYYERTGATDAADEWYRIASDRNVVEAMAYRGLSHIRPGSTLEWSPTLMYKWWKIGSDAGDATCTRYLNIFIWVVIPLLLIFVFGLPVLIVHILNKRAEKQEQANS